MVRDRKGRVPRAVAGDAGQGFVRFFPRTARSSRRDDLPASRRTEKHDIDVVVDRLKVRPEIRQKQRLAESFERRLGIAEAAPWP